MDYTDYDIGFFGNGTVTVSLEGIGSPITDVFVSAPDGSEFGSFSTDGSSIFFDYTIADVLAINEGQVTISFSQRQTFVVPVDFANEEGTSIGENTALGNLSNTVQTVYDASLLSAAGLQAGDVLTGLSFRLDALDDAPIWSVDDYQIRLATSLNPVGSLNSDFTLNRGADFVTVRSGPLTYDGTEYDASSTAPSGGPGVPNAFGPAFVFDTPYIYNGGDLLLEYTHSEINNSLSFPGVQQTGRADAVLEFAGVQSQFARGFDGTVDGFSGFGNGFAPIVQFTTAPFDDSPSGFLVIPLPNGKAVVVPQ